jgi:hypothetical protein
MRASSSAALRRSYLKVENDLTYRGWFELESPERQGLISNWVYQLARLGP